MHAGFWTVMEVKYRMMWFHPWSEGLMPGHWHGKRSWGLGLEYLGRGKIGCTARRGGGTVLSTRLRAPNLISRCCVRGHRMNNRVWECAQYVLDIGGISFLRDSLNLFEVFLFESRGWVVKFFFCTDYDKVRCIFITSSTELSLPRNANSRSAAQLAVFTRASHFPIFRFRWIHFPHTYHIYLRYIFILFSHRRPSFRSGLFPSCFSTKILLPMSS
jgi:hypothetical protein